MPVMLDHTYFHINKLKGIENGEKQEETMRLMEQLHFTTKVLRPLAAYRLKEHQVTQTIRSYSSSIVQALLSSRPKVGDQMEVMLDGRPIGLADYITMDVVNWEYLNLGDARRCGFDTVDDLGQALKRAGYSFRPLYRLLFSWLKEHVESSKDKVIKLLCQSDATYVEIAKRIGSSRQWVHQVAKEIGQTRKRQPPHYRSNITVDKVLELYHRDLLIKEMAPILGCCPSTVTKRLREAGISPGECFSRSMKLDWRGKYHCRDDITVERVLNLYHDELLIKEMAQTLGCNQATVSRRLRQAGISKSECFSRSARIRWRRKRGQ